MDKKSPSIFLIGALVAVAISITFISMDQLPLTRGKSPRIDEVELEVSSVRDRPALRVNVEGNARRYRLYLKNPQDRVVDEGLFLKSEMKDGVESTYLNLTGEKGITPSGGSYRLNITDSEGVTVYENWPIFNGVDLSFESISASFSPKEFTKFFGLNSLTLRVKNSGDLPAYITRIKVSMCSQSGRALIPKDSHLIMPGQTKTFGVKDVVGIDVENPGLYSATFELHDSSAKDNIVAQTRKMIKVD